MDNGCFLREIKEKGTWGEKMERWRKRWCWSWEEVRVRRKKDEVGERGRKKWRKEREIEKNGSQPVQSKIGFFFERRFHICSGWLNQQVWLEFWCYAPLLWLQIACSVSSLVFPSLEHKMFDWIFLFCAIHPYFDYKSVMGLVAVCFLLSTV